MLVIVLANDTTASQTLCLGDIALRLEQTIRRDLFRRSVTHDPPPMLHIYSSSTIGRKSRACDFARGPIAY
jgi:hypothetical protein